jgi:hypothetical protein
MLLDLCKYPCGRPWAGAQQQHMQATALPKVQGLIFAKLIFMPSAFKCRKEQGIWSNYANYCMLNFY